MTCWPVEEARQDRSRGRWEEQGGSLGATGRGKFLSKGGRGQRGWSLKCSQNAILSTCLPHSVGVTLTLPLWYQPGFFTGMEFPVRCWPVVAWWEAGILHSEPWGFLGAHWPTSTYAWLPRCAQYLQGLGMGQ